MPAGQCCCSSSSQGSNAGSPTRGRTCSRVCCITCCYLLLACRSVLLQQQLSVMRCSCHLHHLLSPAACLQISAFAAAASRPALLSCFLHHLLSPAACACRSVLLLQQHLPAMHCSPVLLSPAVTCCLPAGQCCHSSNGQSCAAHMYLASPAFTCCMPVGQCCRCSRRQGSHT
jgi:hypothetical protein